MWSDLFKRLKGNGKAHFPKATIGAELIREYNNFRNTSPTTAFCNAPGVNMLFGQDGKVRACCHNMEFSLGEYPRQSINEIWNGAAAHELRNHLKNYDLSHGCDICKADVNSRNFAEVRAQHFDFLPVSKRYPAMMEFLITNTCNFECVMCRGEYSSLIRKNREKLPPLASPYDQAFIRQLEEFIPHLHETRFSGSGEAFAIDINYEIWEMILKINPACLIMIQTNGSYLNARIKELLGRGRFRIGVSLDSLNKENFESIRIHANFERVMENIRYFSDYSRRKKEKFSLALCVMRQNWRELPAYIEFCNGLNAVATFHKVWFPREYALHNLPADELSEIYGYLSSFNIRAESPLEKLNKQHFDYIVSSIKQWKESAMQRSTESSYLNPLPEAALMDYLKSKLQVALEADGVHTGEIPDILRVCFEKLAGVLDNYQNPEQRLNLLKQICGVPASEVIKTLHSLPVNTIVEQAKTFLVNA